MTDPAAFWVAGLALGSLVGAGLGFVAGYAIGSMKRRRPGHHRRGQPEQRPYSGGTLGLHQWHNDRVRNAMAPGCKPEPPIGPPQRPAPPPTRVVDVHGRTIGHFPCLDEGLIQRGNGRGGITTPKPPIVPKGQPVRTHRWFINNPVQVAECGGPCTINPAHCDCGALWFVDVPTTNPPSSAP